MMSPTVAPTSELDGSAIFTAEVRHQIPKTKLSATMLEITRATEGRLEYGQDSYGHSWKVPALQAGELPEGLAVHDALQNHIDATIDQCRDAGLFEALAREPSRAPSRAALRDHDDDA